MWGRGRAAARGGRSWGRVTGARESRKRGRSQHGTQPTWPAGNLCLGGGIGRFRVGFSDQSGRYELNLDSETLPRPNGSVAASMGQTWFFQVWFRDQSAAGSNFTDGAEITFL